MNAVRHPFPIRRALLLTPGEYIKAAGERLDEATSLFRAGIYYSLAIYSGGVSVECVLSALVMYRLGRGAIPIGMESHNLLAYLRHDPLSVGPQSPFLSQLISTNVSAVIRRWNNFMKYLTTDTLTSLYRGRELIVTRSNGLEGMHENADRLLHAAGNIYIRGKRLCRHYGIV